MASMMPVLFVFQKRFSLFVPLFRPAFISYFPADFPIQWECVSLLSHTREIPLSFFSCEFLLNFLIPTILA